MSKEDNDIIPFTKEAIQEYLYDAVGVWRKNRDRSISGSRKELMGQCYVDAYQCVLCSIFGKMKPTD